MATVARIIVAAPHVVMRASLRVDIQSIQRDDIVFLCDPDTGVDGRMQAQRLADDGVQVG